MSDDPDACLPAPLKDFVFDLHDSARRSMIDSEQGVLYNDTFRDLSQKVRACSACLLLTRNSSAAEIQIWIFLKFTDLICFYILYLKNSTLHNPPGHRVMQLPRNVEVMRYSWLCTMS